MPSLVDCGNAMDLLYLDFRHTKSHGNWVHNKIKLNEDQLTVKVLQKCTVLHFSTKKQKHEHV